MAMSCHIILVDTVFSAALKLIFINIIKVLEMLEVNTWWVVHEANRSRACSYGSICSAMEEAGLLGGNQGSGH